MRKQLQVYFIIFSLMEEGGHFFASVFNVWVFFDMLANVKKKLEQKLENRKTQSHHLGF